MAISICNLLGHACRARHEEIVVVIELECTGLGSVYFASVGSVRARIDFVDECSHDGVAVAHTGQREVEYFLKHTCATYFGIDTDRAILV